MKLVHNFNIKSYNTFHLDVNTKSWLSVNSLDDIRPFIKAHDLKEQKHLIIGGGSNLLFINDFDGLIIKVNINTISVVEEDENFVILKVGAGMVWDDFVDYTVKHAYWGVENLSHIPGTVGASPVQNIGAYGVEAKDCIHKVHAINKYTGDLKVFNNADCKFAYRHSYFKSDDSWIVLEVEYKLSKIPNPKISYKPLNEMFNSVSDIALKAIRTAIIDIRDSKLPNPDDIGNAGSFFKNPVVDSSVFKAIEQQYPNMPKYLLNNDMVKIPAAWLIDTAGWKGYRKGDVGVHEKQALVLVNYNLAKGQDIYALSQEIVKSVKDKFGIELEREVIVIT